MGHNHLLKDERLDLPVQFFEQIIQSIPAALLTRLVGSKPSLKESLFKGFSARPHKLPSLLKQPDIQMRLLRILQSDSAVLAHVLDLWGQEQLPLVAFLEMLDKAFLLENWSALKDLLGPTRFLAGLYLLGRLEDPEIAGRISEDGFWVRQIEPESIEPLIPVLSVWRMIVEEHPEAAQWTDGLIQRDPGLGEEPPQPLSSKTRKPHVETPSHREEDRHKKLQLKLDKAREEQSNLQEQLARLRKENEELRRKAEQWEAGYEARVEEELDRFRRERFRRYTNLDERVFEEAQKRLDGLLRRVERALELQRQADEQYGLISETRQKLVQIELYLREIERIYADSLVVHTEVARMKDALLQEKKRLLQLPGIERALAREPKLLSSADLRQKIRFLDPVPENLPRASQLQSLINRMASLGFIEDAQPLTDEIHQKKRQIMETLYAAFDMPRHPGTQSRAWRTFDDFVRSGQSRKYDLYVDGYNILLKIQARSEPEAQIRRPAPGAAAAAGGASLTAFREEFINAVYRKGSLFGRVFLVFDGIEDHRERRGNVEIIYTDKTRGSTADTVIIEAIRRRKDKMAVLVTADIEIIQATEARVFATVDPRHFYTFIFDMTPPAY